MVSALSHTNPFSLLFIEEEDSASLSSEESCSSLEGPQEEGRRAQLQAFLKPSDPLPVREFKPVDGMFSLERQKELLQGCVAVKAQIEREIGYSERIVYEKCSVDKFHQKIRDIYNLDAAVERRSGILKLLEKFESGQVAWALGCCLDSRELFVLLSALDFGESFVVNCLDHHLECGKMLCRAQRRSDESLLADLLEGVVVARSLFECDISRVFPWVARQFPRDNIEAHLKALCSDELGRVPKIMSFAI